MKDLDTVYRQHAQTVYKFLLSQCRDPQTAEELTQETFYQAVRSIDRFDGSCKVSVWLCQIAKHLWYQHLRKANRETELPEEAELPLVPSAEEETMDVKGRCLLTGLPKLITVTSTEMMDAFEEPVERIMEAVHQVLERTPPELVADISSNGIVMTGGGSLIRGFDKLVTARTGIHTVVAENAIQCVAEGTGKSLESVGEMKDGTMNLSRRKQIN